MRLKLNSKQKGERFNNLSKKLKLLGFEVGKVKYRWISIVKRNNYYGYIDVTEENPFVTEDSIGKYIDAHACENFLILKREDGTYTVKCRNAEASQTNHLKLTKSLIENIKDYISKYDMEPTVVLGKTLDGKYVMINSYGETHEFEMEVKPGFEVIISVPIEFAVSKIYCVINYLSFEEMDYLTENKYHSSGRQFSEEGLLDKFFAGQVNDIIIFNEKLEDVTKNYINTIKKIADEQENDLWASTEDDDYIGFGGDADTDYY